MSKLARTLWLLLSIAALSAALVGPAAGAPASAQAAPPRQAAWGLSLEGSENWDVTPDDPDSILTGFGVGCWGAYANAYGEGGVPHADGTRNKWAQIDAEGKISGGCHIKEGDNSDGRLFKGSLSGTFSPNNSSISNFHLETTEIITNNVGGKISWSNTKLTVDGSGSLLNPPESTYTHQISGRFTIIWTGSNYEPDQETGAVTLKAWISAIGPVFSLDRNRAARFTALLVNGRGLKPKTTVDIYWAGRKLFNIKTTDENGNIPPDTWIWVPDDAAVGVNKVWGEQEGVKTAEFEIEVYLLSEQELLANLEAVMKQYFQQIPANAYGYTSGARWNAAWTFGWFTGVSDGRFRCGWYQGEVLNLLEGLRFDRDINRRAKLDGLDFAPLFSGLTTSALQHAFVGVWPHGAALSAGGALANATFDTAGIAFDPWQKQKPELYAVKSGSADWANSLDYSTHWRFGSQNYYILPTAYNEADAMYNGVYPVTGASYYESVRHKLASDISTIDNKYGQPQKALGVHSPVRVEITDPLGQQLVTQDDGYSLNAIAGADVFSITESGGGYAWIILLPEGAMTAKITGTGPGAYQLLTKNAGQPLYEYPEVPVNAGETAALTLVDENQRVALTTAEGRQLLPEVKPLPDGTPTAPPLVGGLLSSRTILIIVGIAVCGLVGVLGLAGGLAVVWLLRRRAPKRTQPTRPAPQPPTPGQPPSDLGPPAAPTARRVGEPEYRLGEPEYRPSAPALADAPAAPRPSMSTLARLVVIQGMGSPTLLDLGMGSVLLGREVGCGLRIEDPLASRRHAMVEFCEDGWYICDLNSANGTWVNGRAVQREALAPGDRIRIGDVEIVFQAR
jgi:hypothetical protein